MAVPSLNLSKIRVPEELVVMKKNYFGIAVFVLIVVVSISLLVPTLLKKSYRAEIQFKTPSLVEFLKREVLSSVKNFGEYPNILQLDAEYVDVGVGMPVAHISSSKDFLPWERDTLKVIVISESGDEEYIKKATETILEKIFTRLVSGPEMSSEQKQYYINALAQLNERKKVYAQALEDIANDKFNPQSDFGKLKYLIGQTKPTRLNLLNIDIQTINTAMKDLEVEKNYSRSTEDVQGGIDYIQGSFKVASYGPHIKEFITYCIVLIVGGLLFILESRSRKKM